MKQELLNREHLERAQLTLRGFSEIPILPPYNSSPIEGLISDFINQIKRKRPKYAADFDKAKYILIDIGYIGKSQKFILVRFFRYYRKNQVLARFSTFRTFRLYLTLSPLVSGQSLTHSPIWIINYPQPQICRAYKLLFSTTYTTYTRFILQLRGIGPNRQLYKPRIYIQYYNIQMQCRCSAWSIVGCVLSPISQRVLSYL